MAEQTVLAHFLARVRTDAEGTALFHRSRSVDWKRVSWGEYGELVKKVARGFIAQGLQPGCSVAILSENRYEVAVCYMAALLAGGRPTPLYAASDPELVGYIVSHSEAPIVVAENKVQFDKLKAAMARMPSLESICLMEGAGNNKDLLSWEQLLSRGEGFPQTPLDVRLADVDPDSPAVLLYATGAENVPRPVELDHANLLAATEGLHQALGGASGDVVLSFQPLAHVLEQLLCITLPILGGGATWYAKGDKPLIEDLADCRPTLFMAVPRGWEELAIQVGDQLTQAGALTGRALRFAAETSAEVNTRREQGDSVPTGLAFRHRLADGLVYARIKTALGMERVRAFLSGSAPLAPATADFFARLDMPIQEIYGLTEASGVVSVNDHGVSRSGTVGKAIPGVEVRLSEDGEVLVGGPVVFKGYWQDPRRTFEATREGWLYTGDLGVFDDEGYLRVFGRKDEVIQLATGQRVAPSLIELRLRGIPEISRAVLFGTGLPYLVAVLTVHKDLGMRWVKEREVNVVSMRELAGNMSFNNYLRAQIDSINEDLPRHEQIRAFRVLERDFSPADREITPSLKLRREHIYIKHIDVIRKLYGDDWSDARALIG